MTAPTPSFPIQEPSLIDLLKQFKIEVFKDLNCAAPGTIQSFNAAKGTAVVQTVFKSYAPDGSIVDAPILLDCPVFAVQGGGGAFLPPVAAADPCVVLFSDQHLDAWFKTGTPQLPQPEDDRLHDLSDGMAFVGINASNAALAWVANTWRWTYSGAIIDLTNGTVKLTSSSGGEIYLSGGGDTLLQNSAGAVIDLKTSGLIQIKNNAQTLATLIQNLLTTLSGLTVQGPGTYPLTAASIAAITALSAQFSALLVP